MIWCMLVVSFETPYPSTPVALIVILLGAVIGVVKNHTFRSKKTTANGNKSKGNIYLPSVSSRNTLFQS